jgi:hypothetical protein
VPLFDSLYVMLNPDPTSIWVGVAIALAVVVVLLAVIAIRRRGQRPNFEVRPLPADRLQPYAAQLDELERTFVTKPREALAEARQLVDDMLARMGYPARLGTADRARDVAYVNRNRGRRYRAAATVDERSTTEEMRRAMEHLMAVGRDLLAESESNARTAEPVETDRPMPPVGAEQAPAADREPSVERGERRLT